MVSFPHVSQTAFGSRHSGRSSRPFPHVRLFFLSPQRNRTSVFDPPPPPSPDAHYLTNFGEVNLKVITFFAFRRLLFFLRQPLDLGDHFTPPLSPCFLCLRAFVADLSFLILCCCFSRFRSGRVVPLYPPGPGPVSFCL